MTEPGGWFPDPQTVADANITQFLAWLTETGRGDFVDYPRLWAKSVSDIEWFWDGCVRAPAVCPTTSSRYRAFHGP